MKNFNSASLYVLYSFFVLMTGRLKRVVILKIDIVFIIKKIAVLTALFSNILCCKNTMAYFLLKLNKNLIFFPSPNILIVTVLIQLNLINPSNNSS
jgi:hypothetical protein